MEEDGVKNVTVKQVTFTNTQNGLRIKSWARPSSGFVQGVQFLNVVMQNVQNPIIIDQNYCPHNINCPGQVSYNYFFSTLYIQCKKKIFIHGIGFTSSVIQLISCSNMCIYRFRAWKLATSYIGASKVHRRRKLQWNLTAVQEIHARGLDLRMWIWLTRIKKLNPHVPMQMESLLARFYQIVVYWSNNF